MKGKQGSPVKEGGNNKNAANVEAMVLADECDGEDIDELIASMLRSAPNRGGWNGEVRTTAAEKQQIVKWFALGLNGKEIIQELNREREERGEDGRFDEKFNVHKYRQMYGGVINLIRRKYSDQVGKALRFTDKLIRLRQLNDIAEACVVTLRGMSMAEDPEQYRRNSKLLMEVFDRIHKEMGIERYTVVNRRRKVLDREETLRERLTRVSDRLATPVEFLEENIVTAKYRIVEEDEA